MTTDEVHIWQTRAGRPEDVQAAFELLDGAERARALRYRLRRAHDLFVTARALLRQALGHHLGISSAAVALRYGKHGKPELAEESDFRFNLSHSGDTAVLAVSRGREVGIDVEDTSREVDALGLARRFFSRAEAAWVLSHPSELFQAAFFTCWTGKEAYLKARGDGLLFPLDAFEVLPEGDRLNLKVYGDSKDTRHLVQPLQWKDTGGHCAFADPRGLATSLPAAHNQLSPPPPSREPLTSYLASPSPHRSTPLAFSL